MLIHIKKNFKGLVNLKPQILYLGLLSFSINLCFTLQLSNLSGIFKFLGVSSSNLPWLWLAPPIAGLIIQPLVGQLSDDTATRFGKRMPYIISWGVLGALSFLLLPFVGTIMLAVFITLFIDCTLNGSVQGARSLTGDVTKDAERSKAFALQTFFAGIGGAMGTSLPYLIHKFFIPHEKPQIGHIPHNLQYAFVVAGLILIVSLIISFIKIKEKIIKQRYLKKKQGMHIGKRILKILREIWINTKRMPDALRTICIIHALSWIGIFIFWLYFSTALAQNVYGVPYTPNSALPSYAAAWEKANLDTSMYFSLYQYVSILYAFVLYLLPKISRMRLLHGISIGLGGIGMFALGFEHSALWISLSFIGIGIMWGSIVTLPYAIIMQTLPRGKIGIYLGVFNISITIPQLLCGLFLSPMYVFVFGKHAGYLLIFGGVLIMASSLLWIRQEADFKLSDLLFWQTKVTASD